MSRMTCYEIAELLAAHHDGELSEAERKNVDAHLAGCSFCRAELSAIAATSARVRAAGTFAVPAEFKLPEFGDAPSSEPRYRGLGLVASHVAAAIVGALLVFAALHTSLPGDGVVGEAVTAHTRAVEARSEIQVASADTHTVRPWLSARVAFSPPVPTVLPGGATLIGGRVDALAGRPAAVLLYELRRHRIAIFVQPRDASALRVPLDAARNGFNLVGWTRGDFAFLAVSDVNAPELRAVAGGLQD